MWAAMWLASMCDVGPVHDLLLRYCASALARLSVGLPGRSAKTARVIAVCGVRCAVPALLGCVLLQKASGTQCPCDSRASSL